MADAHKTAKVVPKGKPFQKGADVRRNPGGRPKNGNSLTYWLKQKMDATTPDGRTQAEVIAEAIVEGAMKGDSRMVSLIWDRTEGKVAEQVNLSGGLSLYEQGASEAQRIVDAAGRAALLAQIHKLTDGRAKK